MNDDHHHHNGHADATLDVIALLEATVKDDDDGYMALLAGALASDHLSHVLSTLTGVLADELISHHGIDGTLRMLAAQRGHELSPEHGSEDHPAPGDDHECFREADVIPAEISRVGDLIEELDGTMSNAIGDLDATIAANAAELVKLTDAVHRLGDILDKRLS